ANRKASEERAHGRRDRVHVDADDERELLDPEELKHEGGRPREEQEQAARKGNASQSRKSLVLISASRRSTSSTTPSSDRLRTSRHAAKAGTPSGSAGTAAPCTSRTA